MVGPNSSQAMAHHSLNKDEPEEYIRKAVLNDIPDLLELGVQLYEATPYKDAIPLDLKKARFSFEKYILMDDLESIVLVAVHNGEVVGGIAGVLFQPPFGKETYAAELFMYLEPNSRKTRLGADLMDAYENWAKVVGASAIQYPFFLNHHPEKLKRIYERKGFKPEETLYYKNLKD